MFFSEAVFSLQEDRFGKKRLAMTLLYYILPLFERMKILLVNQSEVAKWLPMRECIDVMAGALKMLASGNTLLPLRPIMWLPERVGALAMMPAYMKDINAMGLKVLTLFPGNHGTQYDSHQGAVLLCEATHGSLLAIMGHGHHRNSHRGSERIGDSIACA